MPEPQPTIRPATWRTVLGAAAVGAGVAWLAFQALLYAGGTLPQPGIGAWLPILLFAGATAWVAWITRRAMAGGVPLEAGTAVMRLRAAQAGVMVGAAVGAGYAVLAAYSVASWGTVSARDRLAHAVAAVVAGILWVGCAFVLQRVLRIPPDRDQSDD